ncbi:hypothetical protein CSB45_04815 [candidate division KSB3 bacterium]|uniref:PA14 domain-containing protein n=1 Tax=candidate division KSB3 bacterium TaxID=2044937 RepID=A0A2G6E7J4_9BACT|nr:MAG: hypothetical protein CSB45_04815 [candidate division KSB3 bacterium]PIE30378.1 MAG: hypothetical protein CSA57_03585 [candidate division KSB3 bacterium]
MCDSLVMIHKRFFQFIANCKLLFSIWLCAIIIIAGIWLVIYRQNGLYASYYDCQGEPVLSMKDNTPYLKDLKGDTGLNLLGTNQYSITWNGWILIPKRGTYRFATNSDDGSSLRLDNRLLVANGGVHTLRYVSQKIFLEEGVYPFEVRYMQDGGSAVIQTLWAPPGENEQLLPSSVLFREKPGFTGQTLGRIRLFFKGFSVWHWSVLLIGVALLSLRTQFTFTDIWKSYMAFSRDQKFPWELESWILFGLIVLIVISSVLHFDFRTNPKTGDQASHFMQALSLAYDKDLHYGEEDMLHWREAGWGENTGDLFFKGYGKGYCFGKPYGYSLFLAPFIRLIGPVKGAMTANVCLFLLLLFFSTLLLRMKYRGSLVPMLLMGLYLSSYAYFYIYVIHTEIFLATLTALYFYLLFRYFYTHSLCPLVGATIVLAFGVSEKLPLLLLFAPGFFAALVHGRKYSQKLLLVPLLILSLLLSIFPYLMYSDYHDWNPYSGERYWSFVLPFAPEYDAKLDGEKVETRRLGTGCYFSLQYILATAQKYLETPREFLLSLYFYFVGAHTGMFVFAPLAAFLLFASMSPCHLKWRSSMILSGLFAYILFYVFLFPNNYYGGDQSLGNRYFLQVLPAMAALIVASDFGHRFLWKTAISSVIVSLVFLWPHHMDPAHAFCKLKRTSWLQRCMLTEINQTGLRAFVVDRKGSLNIRLFPCKPAWRYANKPSKLFLFIDGELRKPEFVTPYGNRHSYARISEGMLFYRMFDEPQGNVYIGDGFRYPQKTHAWSYGKSSIILEAFQNKKVCISLKPRQRENMFTLEANGQKKQLKFPAIICSASAEQHTEKAFLYVKITNSGGISSPDSLVFSLEWAKEDDWKAIPVEQILDVTAKE